MLSKPENGWCDITIGDWSDRCSYLVDVPTIVLKALYESCRTHSPAAAEFDAEGWEYIIVFDVLKTYIITNKDEGNDCDGEDYRLITTNISAYNLASQALSDILRDLDGWASWSYRLLSNEEKERNRIRLLDLCNILRLTIP